MTDRDAGSISPGYSLALLARHGPLSLHRMRRVVSEIRQARAGWAACAGIVLAAGLALCGETLVRDVITPDPGFEEFRAQLGDWMFRAVALAILGGGALLIALAAALVWWATCRLFLQKVRLIDSAIGVAAGFLPQIALSAMMILLALLAPAVAGPETRQDWLATLDYVVIILLFGYGVVAYSAATGLSLIRTFIIQLFGVVIGAMLLLGGLSLAAAAFDVGLSSLISLILGG